MPAAEIAALAASGDAAAAETMACYEHRMARALAAIINVVDLDVIVLGGGLSNIELGLMTVADGRLVGNMDGRGDRC